MQVLPWNEVLERNVALSLFTQAVHELHVAAAAGHAVQVCCPAVVAAPASLVVLHTTESSARLVGACEPFSSCGDHTWTKVPPLETRSLILGTVSVKGSAMRDGCTAAPWVVARAGIPVHSTCSWARWPSWGALNHGLQFQQAVPTGRPPSWGGRITPVCKLVSVTEGVLFLNC